MASGEQLVTPPRVWFWNPYGGWQEVRWGIGRWRRRDVENHIRFCRGTNIFGLPNCVAIEKGWKSRPLPDAAGEP